MTATETPAVAAPAAPAVPVVAAPVAPVTAAAPAPQSTLLDEPEAAPAAPTAPVAEVKPAAPTPAPAAPIEYKPFTAPEGTTFDADVITAFGVVAAEAGLSQEHAQAILDKVGPVMQARQAAQQTEQIQATVTAWWDAAKADPDIGGTKLAATLSSAKATLKQFGDARTTEFLRAYHLDNHPEMLRLLSRVGAAVSPDATYVAGTRVTARPSDAEVFYPSMLK